MKTCKKKLTSKFSEIRKGRSKIKAIMSADLDYPVAEGEARMA